MENDDAPTASYYELRLGSIAGKRYEVKEESGGVYSRDGVFSEFKHVRGVLDISEMHDELRSQRELPSEFRVPDGQSALPVGLGFGELFSIWNAMSRLQVVEINPSRIREFQDPSPRYELEPDGSNAASVFERLPVEHRRDLLDALSAVVPGLVRIEPRYVSNKLTIVFTQQAPGQAREFYANQMSDGTLRAFGVLLALVQPRPPRLVVVEEPEVAIHLGALRTLVDILRQHTERGQVLLTTHSADIIDALEIDELRVVWAEEGVSHLAPVAVHTRDTVRRGLITPGELLRSDALDPAAA
jgi:hypothetical protein